MANRVPLEQASRRAFAILTAAALAALATTIGCLVLGIRNGGLSPADISYIQENFPRLSLDFFRPEPMERAQALSFIGGALAMSLALVHFPRLECRISPSAGRTFWALFAATTLGCILFGRTIFGEPVTHFYTFIAAWHPEIPTVWVAVFLIAASPILIPSPQLRGRAISVLAAVSGVALLLLCARISFLAPLNGLLYESRNHNDSATLHSVVQASFGQIPYFDFIPQYGGYGLFAWPFFRLGLDPWIALCSFLFACWLITFGAMAGAVAVASRNWRAACLATVVAFWLSTDVRSTVTVFQHGPFRMLFPAIFLLLFSMCACRPRLIPAIGGALVPVAIYWNPETGIVCFVAALCLLIVDVVGMGKSEASAWKERLTPLSLFLAASILMSAVLQLIAFYFFGRNLSLTDFLQHATLFSKLGFANLPMPLLDVWVPLAFAFCLLLSLPGVSKAPGNVVRHSVLFGFFCAMLFSGLFLYYQGRSYTGNLVAFVFPLICGAFSWLCTGAYSSSDPLDGTHRRGGLRSFRDDVALLAFAVAAAALAGSQITSAPFLNPFSWRMNADDQALRSFIRKESQRKPVAFIISPQAWRLHLLSGIAPPASIPPQSGLLTRLQEKETLEAADPASVYALFHDPIYFHPKVHPGGGFSEEFHARIRSQWIIGAKLVLPSGDFAVLKPKTNPADASSP